MNTYVSTYTTSTNMNSAISTALLPYSTIVGLKGSKYVSSNVLSNYVSYYTTATNMNSAISTGIINQVAINSNYFISSNIFNTFGFDTIALKIASLIPYITGTTFNSCN